MSADVDKIRQQLAESHNWQQQENQWIANQKHWESQEKHWESQYKHWESQDRHWTYQRIYWSVVATIALLSTSVITIIKLFFSD